MLKSLPIIRFRTIIFYLLVGIITMVGILLAASYIVVTSSPTMGDVTFVNASEEPITELRVKVSDRCFVSKDLTVGSKVKFVFEIYGDDGYNCTVTFKSKKRIEQEIGYVTSGINSHHVLLVKSDEIVFQR